MSLVKSHIQFSSLKTNGSMTCESHVTILIRDRVEYEPNLFPNKIKPLVGTFFNQIILI
jgi:hypothetical protein